MSTSLSGEVRATGYLCAFQEFYNAHVSATDELLVDLHLDFALDYGALKRISAQDRIARPAGMDRQTGFRSPWRRDGKEMLKSFGSESLFVLLMGDLGTGGLQNPLWKSHHYGLLLQKTSSQSDPMVPAYMRRGVCVWRMMRSSEDFLNDDGGKALDDAGELDAYLRTHNDNEEKPVSMRRYTQSVTKLFSEVVNIELV